MIPTEKQQYDSLEPFRIGRRAKAPLENHDQDNRIGSVVVHESKDRVELIAVCEESPLFKARSEISRSFREAFQDLLNGSTPPDWEDALLRQEVGA